MYNFVWNNSLWFVAGIAEFLLEKFICKFLWKNLGPKFKQEKELRELKKQVEIEKLKKELEQLKKENSD